MTSWMSGVCAANGINIHYLRTGGSKSPLVLLHGLTGSGVCWAPLARALESEYELLAESRLQTRIGAFDVLTPPNPEYRQLVSAISVPILLVVGDNGAVVSLETAQELQRLNPL